MRCHKCGFNLPWHGPWCEDGVERALERHDQKGAIGMSEEDIVERIRNRPNDAPMETERLLDEAADEIERLRWLLAQLGKVELA